MNRALTIFCLILALCFAAYAEPLWPNGFPVYRQDGQAQYPNGLLLVRPDRCAQYPNGTLIQRLDGRYQYPNGFLIERNGQHQLPDGRLVLSLPPTIWLRDGYWTYTFQCRANMIDFHVFQAIYEGPDFATRFWVDHGRITR